MGHIIRWDNADKTVVLQQYTEGGTKEDLYHLAKKSAEMLKTVTHTVHLIIDERNVELVFTTPDIEYLEKLTPPNQGAVVMVVPRLKISYKRIVQDIAVDIAPHAFGEPYFAISIQQAREFLQEHFNVYYTDLSAD